MSFRTQYEDDGVSTMNASLPSLIHLAGGTDRQYSEPPQTPPQPAIVAAARVGDVDEVRRLISTGVFVDEPYDSSDGHLPNSGGVPGRAALSVAAYAGHLSVVRVLLDAGADVNRVDDGGFTALFLAVFRMELEIVMELLNVEGVDLETRALLGRTVLMLATGLGLSSIVALLLQAGADVTARDDWGRSALGWARAHGRSDIISLLVRYHAPE